MKNLQTLLSAPLIAALALSLSACGGDSHEAVMKDMMGLMTEVAEIIETAKDKESAEAAAKKIDAITSKFEALGKRAEALGEPSPEVAKKLMEENAATMGPMMMKMMGAMNSLKENPEAAEAIGAAMQRFQKAAGATGMGGK